MDTLRVILAIMFVLLTCTGQTQDIEDLDLKVAETNAEALPYDIERIVVRGFDGENPPPRLQAPDRPLFYGYGITAYYVTFDSLIFFNVVRLDAVHRAPDGKMIVSFRQEGNRYTDEFKNYFLSGISPGEKKNIYFENIYLKDKKGNYLKLTERQLFCPHCP